MIRGFFLFLFCKETSWIYEGYVYSGKQFYMVQANICCIDQRRKARSVIFGINGCCGDSASSGCWRKQDVILTRPPSGMAQPQDWDWLDLAEAAWLLASESHVVLWGKIKIMHVVLSGILSDIFCIMCWSENIFKLCLGFVLCCTVLCSFWAVLWAVHWAELTSSFVLMF